MKQTSLERLFGYDHCRHALLLGNSQTRNAISSVVAASRIAITRQRRIFQRRMSFADHLGLVGYSKVAVLPDRQIM
ncbi:hypothetical protein H8A97_39395 [Bradyrhizobium sp. Arg62]|uniref:hypothetical protein n=1 Tax=Bradyrhizobium TaxID=374 RepID=UPI001E5F44DD|nr:MULTISPECIES: hypothetical protein [Bradyrhizobium]MCC8941813.1 hypothetical protein [Bradyrhizobium ivorense]MCC8950964.1 hypothetical protein [Bradyrhizobium brasilense]